VCTATPARAQAVKRSDEEVKALVDAPEVLEGTGRPAEVEAAVEVAGDGVHVHDAEGDAGGEGLGGAQAPGVEVVEGAGVLAVGPALLRGARRVHVRGDDAAPARGEGGGQRLKPAAEAEARTAFGDHAEVLQHRQDVHKLPLLAVRLGRLADGGAPGGICRLVELVGGAELARRRGQGGRLIGREAQQRLPAVVEGGAREGGPEALS
jgi:hypothetical protein